MYEILPKWDKGKILKKITSKSLHARSFKNTSGCHSEVAKRSVAKNQVHWKADELTEGNLFLSL